MTPRLEADRPFAALADHLTHLRGWARLSQRALAQVANISRGAVQRAESGTAAPCLTVLNAYLQACRASEVERDQAHALRNSGRVTQRNRLRALNAPAPALIHTADDLSAALAAAYEQIGAPPVRELKSLAPGRPELPITTAWRIVNRKALPATTEQLLTFLIACGIPVTQQSSYLDAYRRVRAAHPVRCVPPSRHLRQRRHSGTALEKLLKLRLNGGAIRALPDGDLDKYASFAGDCDQYAIFGEDADSMVTSFLHPLDHVPPAAFG